MVQALNWDKANRAERARAGSIEVNEPDDPTEWVPIPKSFWDQWKTDKAKMIASGYRIKKKNGVWRMRFRAANEEQRDRIRSIRDQLTPRT